MKAIVLFLFLFIILGCSRSKNNLSDIAYPVIDLVEIIESDPVEIDLSEIAKSERMIHLETLDEVLLGSIGQIDIDEDLIYILSNHNFFVFDLNGSFIRKIGNKGAGPDEYVRIQNFNFTTNEISFYDSASNKIFEYDKEGNFLRSFSVPSYFEQVGLLGNGNYIGYTPSISGIQDTKLIWFDKQGEVIHTVYHSNVQSERYNVIIQYMYEGAFFYYDKKTYFKEFFNDTIFHIEDNDLSPAYVLNLGKLGAKPHLRKEADLRGNIFDGKMVFVYMFGETSENLFFSAKGMICYNKEKQTAKRVSIISDYKEKPVYPTISKNGKYMILSLNPEDEDNNPSLLLMESKSYPE